jgi:hypothetical protein
MGIYDGEGAATRKQHVIHSFVSTNQEKQGHWDPEKHKSTIKMEKISRGGRSGEE